MTTAKPAMRPARPEFSSGPCAKRPGWSPENLSGAVLGRSHRSKLGKARLKEAIDRTRDVLQVPADYLIGIVPASDTGAVEMAMWSMLGARPVQLLAFESFGKDWVTDVTKQLKIEAEALTAPYGALPDLTKVRPDADLIFTWNGTTSGVRVPNGDFINAAREQHIVVLPAGDNVVRLLPPLTLSEAEAREGLELLGKAAAALEVKAAAQ